MDRAYFGGFCTTKKHTVIYHLDLIIWIKKCGFNEKDFGLLILFLLVMKWRGQVYLVEMFVHDKLNVIWHSTEYPMRSSSCH